MRSCSIFLSVKPELPCITIHLLVAFPTESEVTTCEGHPHFHILCNVLSVCHRFYRNMYRNVCVCVCMYMHTPTYAECYSAFTKGDLPFSTAGVILGVRVLREVIQRLTLQSTAQLKQNASVKSMGLVWSVEGLNRAKRWPFAESRRNLVPGGLRTATPALPVSKAVSCLRLQLGHVSANPGCASLQ